MAKQTPCFKTKTQHTNQCVFVCVCVIVAQRWTAGQQVQGPGFKLRELPNPKCNCIFSRILHNFFSHFQAIFRVCPNGEFRYLYKKYFFKNYFYPVCECLPACLLMQYMHVWCPQNPKEDIGSLRTGAGAGYEPLRGYWEFIKNQQCS